MYLRAVAKSQTTFDFFICASKLVFVAKYCLMFYFVKFSAQGKVRWSPKESFSSGLLLSRVSLDGM